jgi:phosphoribosylglycinamide formyltransferase-1
MERTPVGILLSGRGTGALSLIRAAENPGYPARVALVLSNKADAPGLEKARQAGALVHVVDHRPFGADRESHERAINTALAAAGVRFIALAGYMRILTPYFVQAWAGRMINVHPSLLPLFPGLHTHRQALAAGVKLHGCSVHWVTQGVDAGPLIGQAAVPVLPDDDEESLAARVLAAEHRLFPACLAAAVSGETPPAAPDQVLINPPA